MAQAAYIHAAWRTLTQRADGPTLYDVCDPLLLSSNGGGESHLSRFYHEVLSHPALRMVLKRAGLPLLRSQNLFLAVQRSILAARDEPNPDWQAIGMPIADMLDKLLPPLARRPCAAQSSHAVSPARIDEIIRGCADHLQTSYVRNMFIPAYAAFNLIGDRDLRGRELLLALDGLHDRTYKHATLMFNLARAFILANPAVTDLFNQAWTGLAEPMWAPVQIRHRSAYYDAFFAEALMDYLDSGLASPRETSWAHQAIGNMIRFCLDTSREQVRAPESGRPFTVVTALADKPHSQLSDFFWQLKRDIGFGLYVPDCDTTACAVSAAGKAGTHHPILDQPLLDLFAEYQVGYGNRSNPPTVAINDHIDFDGGVVTWMQNLSGDRPYGNDLDPTLNLDILEAAFLNHTRWRIAETAHRRLTLQRLLRFHARLADTGAFADPRSHIYYLPEVYCAYFGRCYEAFSALPSTIRDALDPDGNCERIRRHVLAYVRDELLAREINAFDAALALLALAKLGAGPESFAPALACIDRRFGEGSRPLAFPPCPLTRTPFKAYEWNKMKTPTRIIVGGPEVTSAFVLSALVHARKHLAD